MATTLVPTGWFKEALNEVAENYKKYPRWMQRDVPLERFYRD